MSLREWWNNRRTYRRVLEEDRERLIRRVEELETLFGAMIREKDARLAEKDAWIRELETENSMNFGHMLVLTNRPPPPYLRRHLDKLDPSKDATDEAEPRVYGKSSMPRRASIEQRMNERFEEKAKREEAAAAARAELEERARLFEERNQNGANSTEAVLAPALGEQ